MHLPLASERNSSRRLSKFVDSSLDSPFAVVLENHIHHNKEDIVARNVYLYVNIFSISDVSTASETFQSHFYLRASWVEPNYDRRQELDEKTWQPDIQIMNAATTPEISEEHLEVVSWRQGHDGSAVLSWSAKYRACFRQKFELRSFPFDTQHLTMTITTQKLNTRLLEDVYDGVCSILRDEYTVLPEFTIHGPIFTPQEELALGKYSILKIKLVAQRLGSYYIWNVYVPLFLLTSMLFVAFFIEVGNISDRLSLSLTIVLASVAYKYVVSQDLPHISYLTMADFYVLGNFIYTALVVFQNALSGWFASIDAEDGKEFDLLCFKVLLIMFIVSNLAYIVASCFCCRPSASTPTIADGSLSDDGDE